MPTLAFHTFSAAVVCIGVLGLVILRPRRLGVAWPAAVGGLAAVALGLLSPHALTTIFTDTWDAAATLIALFLLSEALDSNGFFTWAALHLAHSARGSGWRLYLLMLLLTTGVTALLANDGAVLMLTPIFATLLLKIYPEDGVRLPFLLASGFFADAMSTIFVPSNLTNIILADATHLAFLRVAVWMLVPTLVAFLAGALAFGFRFRHRLAAHYVTARLGDPACAIRDTIAFRSGWMALGLLTAGYALTGELHLPVSLIAGSVALGMLALVHARGLRSAGEVVLAAPWGILVYAVGMFIVMTAAFDARTLDFLVRPLRADVSAEAALPGVFAAGGLLALLSAAANNLPATLIGVLALRTTSHVSLAAIYAIQLGVDIGPKLTPFGSLATLLWMGILARNGIVVTWSRYIRENWWVALVVLAAAFAGLAVSATLLG